MATPESQADGAQSAAPTVELNEFESLLQKEFKVQKDTAKKDAIKAAVQTLAEQALSATALISDNTIKSIEAIIAEIDRKLSQQISVIIHHEDFKTLEGAWRGLH